MKKFICFALILVIFILLASCEKDDGQMPGGNTVKEETEKNYTAEGEIKLTLSDEKLSIPEDARYDGYTFTVFAPTPYGIGKFVAEAPNGDPVNDALFNRNLALTDRLGVTVNAIDLNCYTDKQAQKIIDTVLSGDRGFDVAAVHSTSACAALIMADAVLDFDRLEYCDLEKPWWVSGFTEQCSLKGNNYFAMSSACYGYYSSSACLLFNKDLAEEYGLPNLYELVRTGNWTVDKLIELTKNVSTDLNSDGMYDENDLMAIVSGDKAYFNFWYGAFRQSTVDKGENDEPVFNVKSSRMNSIISKLNELFNTGRRGYIFDSTRGEADFRQAFANSKTLFFVGSAGSAADLREYDVNFGILPLPKLDENQEKYGSWVDPWCLTLCVPTDCENPERTGIILEAMAYYSYRLIMPAVIEQRLFGSGTRDVESLEMLEKYILPNVFFDFGYIYDGWGNGYGELLQTLIPNGSTDSASFIAQRENVAQKHFSDLYDAK